MLTMDQIPVCSVRGVARRNKPAENCHPNLPLLTALQSILAYFYDPHLILFEPNITNHKTVQNCLALDPRLPDEEKPPPTTTRSESDLRPATQLHVCLIACLL